MKTVEMNLADLELCDRTRVRKYKPSENSEIVDEYTEAYRCGLIVEPLDVFQEKGTERYLVADGEHRLLALRRAKISKVDVRLHDGDEVAALDFAIDCNQKHGLRRTKHDRFHAFERIMETPLKDKYRTDTELSEKIGVHKNTIFNYKVQWRNSESGDKETRRKKEKAKDSAAQNTKNGHEARTKTNGTKPETKREPPKAQADDGWTKADDQAVEAITDALSILGKAWKDATRAAQIHMSDTIQQVVRGMR